MNLSAVVAVKVKMDAAMIDLVQNARNELGPLSITSAYRCQLAQCACHQLVLTGPHTTGML